MPVTEHIFAGGGRHAQRLAPRIELSSADRSDDARNGEVVVSACSFVLRIAAEFGRRSFRRREVTAKGCQRIPASGLQRIGDPLFDRRQRTHG